MRSASVEKFGQKIGESPLLSAAIALGIGFILARLLSTQVAVVGPAAGADDAVPCGVNHQSGQCVPHMNPLDLLHSKTRGRPYVLLILGYKDKKTKADKHVALTKHIREVVETVSGMACVRADDIFGAGYDLLTKLHLLLDRATLVIAEISESRPNVFYELGYAMGLKKPTILLLESGVKVPYDLQGLEVFEYENSLDGTEELRSKLGEHLRQRLNPDLPLLRDMLAPPLADRSYIVTSPKYPGKNSRILGQVYDARTFGDHLGILGVISAFGLFYGDAAGLDLISAQHAPPDLLEWDINLYMIGSPKVNPPAKRLLARLCPQWRFGPASWWKKGETDDWPVSLYRVQGGKNVEQIGEKTKVKKEWIWTSDYGIIVRGRHPDHRGRLVFLMAGPHSLGSAAACLAATRPALIAQIRDRLPAGVLEDKSKTFWALVRGVSHAPDYLLSEKDVTIQEVGVER